jgi:hypothetical protein
MSRKFGASRNSDFATARTRNLKNQQKPLTLLADLGIMVTMKSNWLTLTVLVVSCSLLLQAGCQEEAVVEQEPKPAPTPPKPSTADALAQTPLPPGKLGPRIEFERVTHDFGNVGPETQNLCEFRFTNTGDTVLKIVDVTKTCVCTPHSLDKTEYAPGESGTLKVEYKPGTRPGGATQHLSVLSNDMSTPEVELTIEANIVIKVAHEPATLTLLPKDNNAGYPAITLTSLDNQPFSIKHFKSTANCITADYDPSLKTTRFVIQPKVDAQKLIRGLEGVIEIGLTHPECDKVTIPFASPAKYEISPPSIVVLKAEPQKPVTKKIQILNNHGEDFQVKSVSSKNNFLKLLRQQKVENGYEFELQVTPPPVKGKRSVFTDVLLINIKGGEKLQANCSGFYVSKAGAS